MKIFVLISGGMDSATVLAMAIKKVGAENVVAVFINYGQKAKKEIECSKKLADYYNVKLCTYDLSEVFKNSTCALIENSGKELNTGSFLDQQQSSSGNWISSYVPFRNGLILSAAASLAGNLFPNTDIEIFYGAHRDDLLTNGFYADCTKEFIDAMDVAVNKGTYGRIHIRAPLKDMTKDSIVREGLALDVPFEITWSCYADGEKPCGKCASCILREEGFRKNGVKDPAII